MIDRRTNGRRKHRAKPVSAALSEEQFLTFYVTRCNTAAPSSNREIVVLSIPAFGKNYFRIASKLVSFCSGHNNVSLSEIKRKSVLRLEWHFNLDGVPENCINENLRHDGQPISLATRATTASGSLLNGTLCGSNCCPRHLFRTSSPPKIGDTVPNQHVTRHFSPV